MKKIFLLFAVALLIIACNKDDVAPQPTPEPTEIEKLPPATQTGANKVGCLLNGKAFLPSGTRPGGGNPNPYCAYYHDQFVLNFSIIRNENNTSLEGTEQIMLYSVDTLLKEDSIYDIATFNENQYGAYVIYSIQNPKNYESTNEKVGKLHITKLDKEKNIISGTFWFDAVNEQGKKVEIREGRFDMVFDGWAG